MATSSKENIKRRNNPACSCLMMVLSFIRRVYDGVVDFVFGIIYGAIPVKKLPPIKNPLLIESAVGLAEKIRTQQVTSEEVVKAFIDRIKEVNPIVNAVVAERFSKAIEEAVNADNLIKSGSYSKHELINYKPLMGVPFTSKESTAAEGMNWTFGLKCRQSSKATFDAKILKGLKEAGAILIGITNVPELNLWIECRNSIYGQTNNPYDTNHTVGGSSGGEACIVTSCGSPVGLGTDIGGSCRVPAFCCGVYGHKMTGGLINTYGMTFRTGEEKHTIVTAGPITKYAVDIKPVIKAILSETPEKLKLLDLDSKVDVKKLRYFYVEEPADSRVSRINNEMKGAMKKVIKFINDSGSIENPPQKVHLAGFKYSYSLWRYWMSKEEGNFAVDITDKKSKASVWIEVPKKLLGLSEYTLAVILKLIDSALPQPSPIWAEKETEELRSELTSMLGDDGVLLFPSYPSTAPYHFLPFFRPYNFAYWAIFNCLQLPVTQIPIGLSKEKLPLGIQIVAGPYGDRLCAAVAEEIEKLTGGWVPPCNIHVS